MKVLLTALFSGVLILYPFAIYIGLNYLEPSILACFMLGLLLVRVIVVKEKLAKMPWVIPATLLGGLALVLTFFTDSTLGIKLYPVMVNIAMLVVFSYSYKYPPTVIETFARIREKNLSRQGIIYIENVTLMWCVFFICNGLISVYTAFYTSLKIWTFYNGFLSYVLMGCLMAAEYLVRQKVKHSHVIDNTISEKINSEKTIFVQPISDLKQTDD